MLNAAQSEAGAGSYWDTHPMIYASNDVGGHSSGVMTDAGMVDLNTWSQVGRAENGTPILEAPEISVRASGLGGYNDEMARILQQADAPHYTSVNDTPLRVETFGVADSVPVGSNESVAQPTPSLGDQMWNVFQAWRYGQASAGMAASMAMQQVKDAVLPYGGLANSYGPTTLLNDVIGAGKRAWNTGVGMAQGMIDTNPALRVAAALNGTSTALSSSLVDIPDAQARGAHFFDKANLFVGAVSGVGGLRGPVAGQVTTGAVDLAMLPPPSKGVLQRAVDSVIHGDANHVNTVWGSLNANEYTAIRSYMGRTEAGQKVLAAADNRSIFFNFSDGLPPRPTLLGESRGQVANIYLRNTEGGNLYDIVGRQANGLEYSANIGLHEGLHSLGVRGSRRAEALVRLEELRSMGVPINRQAMRQVLTDMKGSYDAYPWRAGGTSPSFPGLEF